MGSIAFVLLSVILFWLTRPPSDFGFLVFVMLVPLFICLQKEDFKYLMFFSLITSFSETFFILNLTDVTWETKLILFGGAHLWFLFLSFVFYLVYINTSKRPLISWLVVPAAWTALSITGLKIINIDLFLYLPLYKNRFFLDIAAIFGIHFLTFLIIFINYQLSKLLYDKKYVLALLLLVITMIGVFWEVPLFSRPQPEYVVNVCIVQPNMSPAEDKAVLADSSKQDAVFYSLFNKELFRGKDLDFIVWPESVINRWIFLIPEYRKHILNLASVTNSYLVIGAPELDSDLKEYNSLFLVSPDGEIQKYRKKRLVPLVERVFSKGSNSELVKTIYGPVDFLICWEALSLQRRTGSVVTFFLSKDLSLGQSSSVLTHLRLAVFNAVLNNNSMVAANYTGPSMIIDKSGTIIKEAPFFRPFILYGSLPIYTQNTGDTGLIISYAIYFILLLYGFFLVIREKWPVLLTSVKISEILLSLVLLVLLLHFNNRATKELIWQYPLEPELLNPVYSQKPISITIKDERKKCLKEVLQFYGIYLEKYFCQEEINELGLSDLLYSLGLTLDEIEYGKLPTMNVPCLVETKTGWIVVYGNNKMMKDQKEKTVIPDESEIKRILVVKPLADG